MKTPPFLLGAALIFWGWSADLLPLSIIMAALLEGAHVLKFRLELSRTDFSRIADLTALVLVGVVIYLFVSEGILDMGFLLIQWFPVLFFGLVLAQVYSTQGNVDMCALFWTLRRQQPRYYAPEPKAVNLTYPYAVICLLAASSMNIRTRTFYVVFLLLALWALWTIRARHYPAVLWIGVILVAVLIGYRGQRMLRQVQYALEHSTTLMRLITGMRPPEIDPYETTTAIGNVGTIKLSNRTVFRVKSDTTPYSSLLLREATYNVYHHSRWFAVRDEFSPLVPEIDRTTWILRSEANSQTARVPDSLNRLLIMSRLEEGKGILKLPTHTVRVEHLLAALVAQNRFGVVKVEEGPNTLTYASVFGSRGAVDSPPAEPDLQLPPDDAPELRAIVEQYKLKADTPRETVAAIAAFFRKAFSYSLTLKRSQSQTPIISFLRETRSGHCEYFATATVLLLRAAGIPARYAVGYAADRITPDKWTLVRGRDAHAWTVVYLDGSWQDFDTTPPSWRSVEAQLASPFEWLANMRDTILFTFAEWQQKGYFLRGIIILAWGLVPVLIVLIWRWYRKKRTTHRSQAEEKPLDAAIPIPGGDSAFYAVIAYLQQVGIERRESEPLSLWIQRLERHLPIQAVETLAPLLTWHYRYRFDPNGLSSEEQRHFQASVQEWLTHTARNSSGH